MKRLTLIRHAKSDWEYPELDDHDRPLNKRGLEAAPKVGNYLMENDVNPDIMLSSTANRAITTAKLIAKKLQFRQQKIQPVKDLYLADIPDYEDIIRSLDDTAGNQHLMIVSHNPGTHELVQHITGGNEINRFTTCAVALIELNIDYWGEIGPGCGKLLHFITPKEIPAA